MPSYPGIFAFRCDSGDVSARLILTLPQVEGLRASINDALANDAMVRKRLHARE
ncbi:MAG: hypothetical protein E7D48_05570 [Bifidobacterium scardovii]|uniref:hypothetical protein n=1 Tax=Bifidobacterium scardovii TaxID=158787 RepID=UPI00205001E4|nr:hypothetical protein [Bifidobacterium scardovii]MDU2421557.1 hypothetical protein [Bifidobacterium scardovii]DAZ70537.1 MAG TPA: hypothetical protein [Caudoviricetes sp.]